MFFMALDTSVEVIHAKDVGLALVNAIDSNEIWNKTFNLSGGKQCQILFRDNINDVLEIMGFGRGFLPDEAFSKHHTHCGFFDDQETSYLQSKKWIGLKRYLIPIVKPIIRWYILRKSEFYQNYKKKNLK